MPKIDNVALRVGPLKPALASIKASCDYMGGVSRAKFYADILPLLETVKLGNRNFVVVASMDRLIDTSRQPPAQSTEETLRKLAPNADIIFERLAVTATQIRDWRLPTRPTKKSDSRAKTFGAELVELDAIEPEQLRQLVRNAIEQHLPPEQFAVLKAAEESERMQLAGLVGMLDGDAP